MSGGSMDYLYQRVQDANFAKSTPERRAFEEHLRLVAKALRSIEWVDSNDSAPGSENAAILACLPPRAVLDVLLSDGERLIQQLADELRRAKTPPCPSNADTTTPR